MQTDNQKKYVYFSDLNRNPKFNTLYSWPVIIAFLAFFWPIGLFLMYKRFSIDKAASSKNSKKVAAIGGISVMIAVVYVITGLTGNLDVSDGSNVLFGMVIMAVLFGGGGAYLLFASQKMKAFGERFKQYEYLIISKNEFLIDNIASESGIPCETVKNDLFKLIKCGYFSGSYINEVNREFVLLHYSLQPSRMTHDLIADKQKTVVCKNCGASNGIVEGQRYECEYCGSKL